MTLFLAFVTIGKVLAVSLGVGAATLAVINFFAAIADGYIDETERRMMGVVQVVLNVAMALVLLTTITLLCPEYSTYGLLNMSAFSYGQILVLLVLYTTALLISLERLSTTFGPAFLAGSWYALGILVSLEVLDATDLTFLQLSLGYVSWLILSVGIVNGIMATLKARKEAR